MTKFAHETDAGAARLVRLFEEALRCLESTDLPGANAVLEKAYAEAALVTEETGNEFEERG